MNSQAHPILLELAEQLPEAAQTLKNIQEPKAYEEIARQAKKEMRCLQNRVGSLEDEPAARTFLEESGYRAWLNEADDEDRLRVIGTLGLIAELSDELAED